MKKCAGSFWLPLRDAATTTLVVLAAALVPTWSYAQQDQALLDQVKQCAQIADAAARYACFDKATAATGAPRSGSAGAAGTATRSRIPAAPPVAPTAPSEPTKPEVAQPSAQGAPFNPPAVEAARQVKADTEQNIYLDKITELKEREPGKWLVTLASGQQWYQVESKRYPLNVGMEVKIYPGLFGSSWRMTASELNGYVQVKRVK